MVDWIWTELQQGAPGWAEWVSAWAFQAALLLTALLLFLRVWRNGPAEARQHLLAAGAAVVLIMPLARSLLPLLDISLLLPLPQGLPRMGLFWDGGWMTDLFLCSWLAGLLLVGLHWAISAWQVRRILDGASRVGLRETREMASRISLQLGLKRCPDLRVSGQVESPFVCRIVRPVVVLPVGYLHWSRERTRMVLRHELHHVAGRDLLWQTVSLAVCALHWFNPLAWMVRRHLCVEQERACDRGVIRMGEDPSGYAELLLRTSLGLQGGMAVPGLGFLKRFSLRQRLFEILRMRSQAPREPAWATRTVPWLLVLSIGFSLSAARTRQPVFMSDQETHVRAASQPGVESSRPLQLDFNLPRRHRPTALAASAQMNAGVRGLHSGLDMFDPSSVRGLRTSLRGDRVGPYPVRQSVLPLPAAGQIASALDADDVRLAWLYPTFPSPAESPPPGPGGQPRPNGDSPPQSLPPEQAEPAPAPESPGLQIRSIAIPSLGGITAAAADVTVTGIVVGSSTLPSGAIHPFLWTRQTGTMDLGVPDGWLAAWAERVNERGEVLVRAFRRISSGLEEGSLFLWSPVEGYAPVGAVAGCERVVAADLNAEGQVVGLCDLGYRKAGFFWSRSSGVVGMGWLESGPLANRNTLPVGLNRNGVIAGTSGSHAFLWTLAEGLRGLQVDELESQVGEPIVSSHVDSLNDAGQVVGSLKTPRNSWAVLWEAGQARLIEPLHSLDEPDILRVWAEALAVNESGEVLGRSIALMETEEGSRRLVWSAFLWNPLEGTRRVSDLDQVAASFQAVHRQFNDRRQFAGQIELAQGSLAAHQAMLWTPSEGVQVLDVWEGDEMSAATAVSRNGLVVGWGHGFDYQAQRRTTPMRALLWEVVEGPSLEAEPPSTDPPAPESAGGEGPPADRPIAEKGRESL